jgi:hypothetical protein
MSDEETSDVFKQEARSTLPNGLQLLAIEFEMHQWDWKNGWKPVISWGNDVCDENLIVFSQFEAYFNAIGTIGSTFRGEQNLFGARPYERFRVDVVASPDVLQAWLFENGNYRWKRKFEFTHANKRFALKFSNVRQLDSMAHWHDESMDDIPGFDLYSHKNIDPDGFKSGKEGQEFAPGDFARWITAAQSTAADFERLTALTEACGNDILIAGATLERRRAKPRPQTFLVPGLIPRGAVTLLLGNKKVGKSAIAMELAVAVARGEMGWLGFPINNDKIRGFAVCLSGEDSEESAMERVSLMSDGENPMMLEIIPADGSEIDTLLARLEKQKIDLLIVDPARKYYKGDEDSSDATSEFFTKLETFARKKQCAVLVLHHLKRNANPRTLADVARQYRGSSVFLDRPRVTLAMLRQSDETHFGIPAPDGVPLHNFRQSTMFSGVRRLRRDETTFRHVSLDSQAVPKEIADGVLDRVLKAVSRLLREGQRITRTGRAAVFERKAAEVVGLSRVTVRDAVERLLATGQLCCDTHGALVLSDAAA